MKEREDYRTAEFSTWRSYSVLMSKAGVPPQCRAQQVVNFLRASVPRSVIAERRMLTSHHTGIHNLFSNFAKDEGQKKITPQTTNCNLHHTHGMSTSVVADATPYKFKFFFSLPAASDPQAPLQKLSLYSARSRMESCFL